VCSLGNLIYFQKNHTNSTFLQSIGEDHQKSNELDLNSSIFHHPSLDNNSSSSVDVAKYDSMGLELHYLQKRAMLD
jgi:hypothetical protein